MSPPSSFRNTPANDAQPAGEVALRANDPHKLRRLSGARLPALARIPRFIGPGPLNHAYLETKARRSGHRLYPNGGRDA